MQIRVLVVSSLLASLLLVTIMVFSAFFFYLEKNDENRSTVFSTTTTTTIPDIIPLTSRTKFKCNPSFKQTTTTTDASCSMSFHRVMDFGKKLLTFPKSTAVGDFNSDGCLDIAVANYYDDYLSIFFGDGNGSFVHASDYSTGDGSQPHMIVTNDINNDNRLDLILTYTGMNRIGLFFGDDEGQFQPQIFLSTGARSNPMGFAIQDINNDTHLDIIVAEAALSRMGIFLGFGDGSFHEHQIHFTGTNSYPTSVMIGDLNNDNRSDIIVADSNLGAGRTFLGVGNGKFLTVTDDRYSIASTWIDGGDFNADGYLDVAYLSDIDGAMIIFLGSANGTLRPHSYHVLETNSVPHMFVVADLDNNGHQDILVVDDSSDRIFPLISSGDGWFEGQGPLTPGAFTVPNWLSLGDFNNDGRLDFITANFFSDTIGVFINTC